MVSHKDLDEVFPMWWNFATLFRIARISAFSSFGVCVCVCVCDTSVGLTTAHDAQDPCVSSFATLVLLVSCYVVILCGPVVSLYP